MVLTICPNPSIDTYAWLPTFVKGQANRIDVMKEFPGGKGIHVAMALKELGCTVSLLGNWAGPNGEWIKESRQLQGIEVMGPELNGNTRRCYTFRSESDAQLNNSELLEPGPEMSTQDWKSFLAVFNSTLPHCDMVCLSGSWPKGAPNNAYYQLLELCAKADKKVILDCSGIQLEHALQSKFYGLHINADEAVANFGTTDSSEIYNNLRDRVSLLALTKGKEGLYLFGEANRAHANVLVKKVKSTVGSGDCLTAGIAYAVYNGLQFEEWARYGAACGAANCMNEDLGILRAQDVDKLLPMVNVLPISDTATP